MTRQADNTVRLSVRDWVGIIAIVVTVLISLLSAFLHHDRLLMQVVTQQQEMDRRLTKIESKLEDMKP
jgi:uncharacterized membrane-anchored protein YhcB (DUF1043 family)